MTLTRRGFIESLATAALAGMACCATPGPKSVSTGRRPNVLFVAVDDLRPLLACYGVPFIHTPNIDRLAARGVVFDKAYCQDAVCSPSRTSVLTGLLPDSTRIFDNHTHFRVYNPDVVTLPQHFKDHGYHTRAFGKIYHSCFERAYVGDRMDDPPSWSAPSYFPSPQYYHSEEGMRAAREVFARRPRCNREQTQACLHSKLDAPDPDADRSEAALDQWTDHFVLASITEAPDVPDSVPYDGQVAEHAVAFLESRPVEPFFLAVGFMKPHVPYVAPKRYWDLYDPAELPLAKNPEEPEGMPPIAMLYQHDHGAYLGVEMEGPVDEATARHLIHGYAACVSYMDAQFGRVLDALERQGYLDDTIVVFWGDHGYHLGENARWGKQTCFETATRSPLIVAAPAGVRGASCAHPSELVSLYPTLCDLAGLPVPGHVQGPSLAPLVADPGRSWEGAALSQFPRPVRVSGPEVRPEPDDCMGYSIRTDRYRLTLWTRVLPPHDEVAAELYDYERDPLETVNLIDRAEYASVVANLRKVLTARRAAGRPEAKT